MLDDDYMPLAEAIRLACVKNRGSLSPRDIAQGHAKRSGHRVECVDGAAAASRLSRRPIDGTQSILGQPLVCLHG